MSQICRRSGVIFNFQKLKCYEKKVFSRQLSCVFLFSEGCINERRLRKNYSRFLIDRAYVRGINSYKLGTVSLSGAFMKFLALSLIIASFFLLPSAKAGCERKGYKIQFVYGEKAVSLMKIMVNFPNSHIDAVKNCEGAVRIRGFYNRWFSPQYKDANCRKGPNLKDSVCVIYGDTGCFDPDLNRRAYELWKLIDTDECLPVND